MNKVLVGLFSGVIMVCSFMASAESNEAVGVVDYQKLGQSISFQDLFKSKVEASMGSSRKDMEALRKELQDKQKALSDNKMSEDKKKSVQATIDEKRKKLTALQSEVQKKMMEVRTAYADDLKQKLETVVGQVAAKHNLSMVFMSNSLAYAPNKVDITDEVITALSKELGVKPNSSSNKPMGMGANRMNRMMRANGVSQ